MQPSDVGSNTANLTELFCGPDHPPAQTLEERARREDPALLKTLLEQMLLIRRFEEKAAELYTLGKIGGFCHLYIGQEAVAVGAISTLEPDDYILTSYREHGHALVRGMDPGEVMAELCGKQSGVSKGKGGRCTFLTNAGASWGDMPSLEARSRLRLGRLLPPSTSSNPASRFAFSARRQSISDRSMSR